LACVPHARGVRTTCARRMVVGVMYDNVIE
jgi:hypothetical protein